MPSRLKALKEYLGRITELPIQFVLHYARRRFEEPEMARIDLVTLRSLEAEPPPLS